MSNEFLVFYVTFPNESAARQISDQLIELKLIACANIFPIQSVYWWENEIVSEGEWVAILKTRLLLEAQVEKKIEELHSYEVPCILRYQVRANKAYCQWIVECTTADV
ncbi:MAG: divalent-cation tolerance protein CutA [Lewinellaceae bacterium]|nr:divalent-cation tolerance protein CutA [Saprospiraceae bacterium]MCB9342485.1 divalent-cation tolerance protein CutA [Lewinellaceae bacterium]